MSTARRRPRSQALAYLADGRVSLAVGTHTHVPTADQRILPGGTAYISDAGMCGAYESIIGLAGDAPLARFTRKRPGPRAAPAAGEATLCAVLVETDDTTGLARHIGVLRQGGVLTKSGRLTRPAVVTDLVRSSD